MSKLQDAFRDSRLLLLMAEMGWDVSTVDFGARSVDEWRALLQETAQGLDGVRLLAVVTVALGFSVTPESAVM